MEKNKIIAVFGGSFNPPLISHFSLAEQILKTYKEIEKIIFVPVSKKYNKKGLIDDKFRFDMLKIGCKGYNKMEVSNIELNRPNQAFTIDTLDEIKRQNINKDIYFIIGTDNLKELKNWHRAEDLVNKYKFFVLERNQDVFENIIQNDEFLKKHSLAFVNLKNIKRIYLSSSMVRKMIKEGQNIKSFIPLEIVEYINENNLY